MIIDAPSGLSGTGGVVAIHNLIFNLIFNNGTTSVAAKEMTGEITNLITLFEKRIRQMSSLKIENGMKTGS